MFEEITKRIAAAKIVPVVKMDEPDVALDLAKALLAGGITVIEITFRTTEGEAGFLKIAECIKKVSEGCPEILVGAGTVINPQLAKKAAEAGAKFLMAPGFNHATVDWCIENNVPVFPGINNPSLVEEALMKGLKVLKFFPAEVCGGTKMLKALAGPFPSVKFIPTGGISSENIKSYIDCKNTVAAGGSWMVKEDLIKERNWAEITRLAKEAVESLK